MNAAKGLEVRELGANVVWTDDLAYGSGDPHAIVVYWFRLDIPQLADGDRLLSASERLRTDKLKTSDHRRRFVASHVALRQILGRYCECEPRQVALQIDTHGKPSIARSLHQTVPHDKRELQFSLSRSGDCGLLGVVWNRPLGVDLEIVHSHVNVDHLTIDFLSGAEQRYVRSFPAPQQTAAFYRVWTLKEAAAKAAGLGLVENPRAFEVVPGDVELNDGRSSVEFDGASCSIRLIDGQPLAVRKWSCHQRQFSVGSDSFVAAVCAGPLLIPDEA